MLTKKLPLMVIGIFVIALSVTGWFLYTNFYSTIVQAEQVITLREQVALVSFNEGLWDKVHEKLNAKKEPVVFPPNLRDPFKL